MAELEVLARVLREPLGFEAQVALAAAALRRVYGFTIFTAMRYHRASDETERVFSTAPDAFLVGGRKQRKTNGWTEKVLDRGEIHVGSTADDIRAIFDDHALIAAQGCAAILNIPVRFDGRTLGTLNLMAEAHRYDTADHALALAFAAVMVPVLGREDRPELG